MHLTGRRARQQREEVPPRPAGGRVTRRGSRLYWALGECRGRAGFRVWEFGRAREVGSRG
eukprot:816633-Rhodomonas_salina.1